MTTLRLNKQQDNKDLLLDVRNTFSNVTDYVRSQFEQANIELSPYPHITIDNILPSDLYNKIIENRIPDDCLQTLYQLGRVPSNFYQSRKLLVLQPRMLILNDQLREFWEPLSLWLDNEFKQIVMEKFSTLLAERFNNGVPKLHAETLYTRDKTGYKLGPHTDSKVKVLTLLIYLPRDSSNAELGTAMYQHKDSEFRCSGGPHYDYADFQKIAVSNYVPNRLFGFFKTNNSFHGVEPITVNVQRDLLIYDIQCNE